MTDYTYGHIRPGLSPRLTSTLELAPRDPDACRECGGRASDMGFRCQRCDGTGREPTDAPQLPEEVDDDRDC